MVVFLFFIDRHQHTEHVIAVVVGIVDAVEHVNGLGVILFAEIEVGQYFLVGGDVRVKGSCLLHAALCLVVLLQCVVVLCQKIPSLRLRGVNGDTMA